MLSVTHNLTIKRKGPSKWNYQYFVQEATRIHEGKYDYSLTLAEEVTGIKCRVTIRCNKCKNIWKPIMDNHIHGKNGCELCGRRSKSWDLENFLKVAFSIHGVSYSYSEITEEHIQLADSRLPITCNTCKTRWTPTLTSHISKKKGCAVCAQRVPWNLQRVLRKAHEIHHDNFDYSMVRKEHIKNNLSQIPVRCCKCDRTRWPVINHHFNDKKDCPNCHASHGERECQHILKILTLPYQVQVSLPLLPLKRYDFSFTFQNRNYILEFDGQHHFEYTNFFHRTEEKFKESQQPDIIKTYTAMQSGLCVIRIDYTQINNIEYHIRNALSSLINIYTLYVSNTIIYKYILDAINNS